MRRKALSEANKAESGQIQRHAAARVRTSPLLAARAARPAAARCLAHRFRCTSINLGCRRSASGRAPLAPAPFLVVAALVAACDAFALLVVQLSARAWRDAPSPSSSPFPTPAAPRPAAGKRKRIDFEGAGAAPKGCLASPSLGRGPRFASRPSGKGGPRWARPGVPALAEGAHG